MKLNASTALAAALVIPAMLSAGCLRGASAAKELAEDAVAEAIVTQSISSYNEAAINVSVNDASLSMECNTGGTVSWEDLSTEDLICYEVDSRGCDFETGNERAFAIEGSSTLCGSDDFTVTESSLEAGQSYSIDGSATVTTSEASRTCDYSLDVTVDSVLGDGAEYEVTVAGNLCGTRAYAASFSIAVEGNVTATIE